MGRKVIAALMKMQPPGDDIHERLEWAIGLPQCRCEVFVYFYWRAVGDDLRNLLHGGPHREIAKKREEPPKHEASLSIVQALAGYATHEIRTRTV